MTYKYKRVTTYLSMGALMLPKMNEKRSSLEKSRAQYSKGAA